MINKIASAGITLTALQGAFREKKERGVELLLGQSINNHVRVTKVKTKVADIVLAVKNTLQ